MRDAPGPRRACRLPHEPCGAMPPGSDADTRGTRGRTRILPVPLCGSGHWGVGAGHSHLRACQLRQRDGR
eukprot:588898-Prymnesium_polylepis.2